MAIFNITNDSGFVPRTAFLVDLLLEACNIFDEANYTETYYHNGNNSLPEFGDIIYLNATGPELVVNIDNRMTTFPANSLVTNGIKTNSEGESIEYFCGK